ncbi:MAG: HEAT repeat domain-containing protein [Archangium sp.]
MRRAARHESADVRFGVVMAMSGHAESAAVETLVTLSSDVDDDVGNWATFALGALSEVDTPEVRRALSEPDDALRGEALNGLARRGDTSVLAQLRRELAGERVCVSFVEAAGALGDASLLPLLEALRGDDDAFFSATVEEAIAALRPT